MLHDLFGGMSTRASADGIRAAMRIYGLDAQEIHAGVATETPNTKPSERLQDMLHRNQQYRDSLTAKGVNVLEGYLRETREQVDEKKVDVLLALQVADIVDRINRGTSNIECIVMLSEDMDLMPSYEYAAERGVTVYAVANDTLFTRKDQTKWFILHEEVARRIGDLDKTNGTPARVNLARTALGLNPSTLPTKWRSVWSQRPGPVVLSNNRGVRGNWYSQKALVAGDKKDLYPVGVSFKEGGDLYPCLELSDSAPQPGPFHGVDEATVTAWVSPTKVRATLSTGKGCTITVAPGSVLIGDRVAIASVSRTTGLARYYVGPVQPWQEPTGWPLPRPVGRATLTQTPTGEPFWTASIDQHNVDVRIHNKWLTHAMTGSRIMIALTSADTATGTFTAMPLSCCLP